MAKQWQTIMHVMPAAQECVAAFCEYYGVDEKTVQDGAVSNYVRAHAQDFTGLIEGYREMAALNEEICAEFTACESEADRTC
ncbi:hypothetical protein [Lacticaseibacillus hulanensis]|jgi:CopG family transcriptional regulator/antitoxin EndoAI|uniref:hypothetical protein n=1 Tax=Lacticaseibacillus hulanensis TaxID=2493111 RepID=UPI000FD73863|nr:hypothetical protein [Lacticaseibacillus hulanensis]